MDRLQQAIQKARQERAAREPLSEPLHLSREQRYSSEQPDSDLWKALPEITISAKTAKKKRLLSYFGGPDAATYDMLRTKVLQQTLSNGWRRLALTSPYSGTGKSTTTANLAFSLGRQTDLRIIVIDFDMRKIGLAGILGQTGHNSMADVITSKIPFQEHAVRHGDNVIFGLNYAPARNPSEILQSRQMVETLEQIEETYNPDLVLFDTPPLMVSDDSHGFLKNVDCALLVVAAEKTSMDVIDLAERQLAELTNVMGIVLNKCRYISRAYGNEYGVY